MKTYKILTNTPAGKPERFFLKTEVFPEEIKNLLIEYFSLKGPYKMSALSMPHYYDVLVSLKGNALLASGNKYHEVSSNFIIKIPYDKHYGIQLKNNQEFYFVRFRKLMDKDDAQVISQNIIKHSSLYIRPFSECPIYLDDIKSTKTVNRMLLPEGFVPRFCIGSVETRGPDKVGEHEHAMLDQLYFGIDNCKCTCFADGESALLTENMFLHIPLGSKHSVLVADGDILNYIWLDFFLTLEGQKYMDEKHKIMEK